MSEFFGGDEDGYYDEDGNYIPYAAGGGDSGGGLPSSLTGGGGGDGSGGAYPSGGSNYYAPTYGGGGSNIYNTPRPTTTGGETGGAIQPPPSTGTPSTSNVTNTTNNHISASNSVGLPSMTNNLSVPQPQNFKYNPISIGTSGAAPLPGLPAHDPMPTPPSAPGSQAPKPVGSPVTFGSPTAQQSQPTQGGSRIGKIADAIGGAMGIPQAVKRYSGVYDALHPQKPKTAAQLAAEAYQNTYGLS